MTMLTKMKAIMIIKMPLIFKALPPGDSSGDEDATYRKPPRGLTRLS